MNDILLLITEKNIKNSFGANIKQDIKRQVFCEKKSIRSNEFYQAEMLGLKLELMFEIWQCDYQGEKVIEYNNVRYEIKRTYHKKNEKVELVCSSLVNE